MNWKKKLKRWSCLSLLGIGLSACSNIKKLLPEKAVLKTKERQKYLSASPHQVEYTSGLYCDFPVIPIQVWAATYDLDIVLVSNHPDWDMHEFAQVNTPKGKLWLMKDARKPELNQFIVCDLEEEKIREWLPELPVGRKAYPVKVLNKSTTKRLDLAFEYENQEGVLIKASYQGKRPKTKQAKRNGSTMGHSKEQLLAVLDLPVKDFGKKASITYDGKDYGIKKLLGLVPFQMALTQTQGGLSIGRYEMSDGENNTLNTVHQKAHKVLQNWIIEAGDSAVVVHQKGDFRTLSYEFTREQENLYLHKASVQQWDKKQKGIEIHFAPALPELRRKFKGQFRSNFVIDIAGQASHAIGTVVVEWKGDQLELALEPTAPWWVVDRPMKTIISYQDGKAMIDIVRE